MTTKKAKRPQSEAVREAEVIVKAMATRTPNDARAYLAARLRTLLRRANNHGWNEGWAAHVDEIRQREEKSR